MSCFCFSFSVLVQGWRVPLSVQFLSSPALLRLERPVLLQFCSAPAFFIKAGCHMFAVVLPFYNLAGGCRLQCLLQFFRDLAFFKAVGGGLGCSFALLRSRSRLERSISVTASRTKAGRPIFSRSPAVLQRGLRLGRLIFPIHF